MKDRVASGDTLNLGDKGRAVVVLQRQLTRAGIAVPRSDSFDARTETAVKKLQAAAGLEATGEVDLHTLGRLTGLSQFVSHGFKQAAHVGQRGADIGAMEKRLKELKFKVGKMDGVFDARLASAVKQFQKSRGLKNRNGRIGNGTWKTAKKALAIEQRLAKSPKLRLVRDLALAAKKAGIPAELPLMTALVESNFSNPSGGDRDSVGMFQQRDAWGPYSVRHDPRKSVQMFLKGGRAGQPGAVDFKGRYKNRGSAAYGEWCQAVQVSAFPDRYQQRLGEARRLLKAAGVPYGLKKH